METPDLDLSLSLSLPQHSSDQFYGLNSVTGNQFYGLNSVTEVPATRNYLTAKSARITGVDTISNLPIYVLDEILGCLPLKDAVKTSILSRDWRYKWVTRQELEFDYHFFKLFANVQLANTIIDQVLLLHKGPILKFRLQGGNSKTLPDIDRWILLLSNKIVQEFTLQAHSRKKYHLPPHLFTFQHLRHLKVDQCLFHPPPGFKGFEKLISLDLEDVTFGPAALENLISRCPLLEILRLIWCKKFDILEIDAANLKCFDFKGKSKSICFKNVPLLKNLSLYLARPIPTDEPPVCYNLTKFFSYMPCLMELNIGGYLLKCLTMGSLPENHLTTLNNVKSFTIRRMSFSTIEEVSGVIYLIASCPKLQKLTIECDTINGTVEPVLRYLRDQSSLYGVGKLLQRVDMKDFSKVKTVMEFVRLILASSPVLEKISFQNYAFMIFGPGSQIIEEVKQFHRASPNVEFIFNEVEVEEVKIPMQGNMFSFI